MDNVNKLYIMLTTLFGEAQERASLEDRDRGAAMVEYALLVVGIAVVVGVAALALGGRIRDLFGTVIP
jgi:Flp pilus assembly pilin Flp